jgi:diguanylate cyclase (GGDEF)-like protein
LTRLRTFSAIVAILTLAAISAVTLLEAHADASRRAQVQIGALRLALSDLESAPFSANRGASGAAAPARARAQITADEAALTRGLTARSGHALTPASRAMIADLSSLEVTVARIYQISARAPSINDSTSIATLPHLLKLQANRLFDRLNQTARADAGRAQRARMAAAVGTALSMLALLAGFLLFYLRSDRARRENARLLRISRHEARTDALTGLGNRRALEDDLAAVDRVTEASAEVLLAIFDLNGFKHYNDTFGHGSGDALLTRLGERFAQTVRLSGSAYRMGGDEFCLLARADPAAAEQLLANAASALTEQGEGWSISCARGAAWIPSEAGTAEEALAVADRRMYRNKADRLSTGTKLTPLADLPG